MISKNLEASLNRVLLIASNFNLKYAKVEHLLLALTKNVDVNYVLSRYNIRADKPAIWIAFYQGRTLSLMAIVVI